MKKKFNLNELIWFLILVGFACYFYMTISANKITLFVHPKMVKYVKFALYFFIVLVIFQGKNIFTNSKAKKLKFGYIMFLIPLILGSILNPEGVTPYSVISKGFSLTSQWKINNLKHKHILLKNGAEVCEHDDESTHFVEDTDFIGNFNVTLKKPIVSTSLIKGKTINITNENFINTYEEIYGNPHNYVGTFINMKGFIYNQKGLNRTEFILSRIIVSCCAADAQLVGILCDNSEEKIFAEGTWVNIEGILSEREFKDTKSGEIIIIPIIKVSKIKKTDQQSNEYIYN